MEHFVAILLFVGNEDVRHSSGQRTVWPVTAPLWVNPCAKVVEALRRLVSKDTFSPKLVAENPAGKAIFQGRIPTIMPVVVWIFRHS
jgi:hypothetical protein